MKDGSAVNFLGLTSDGRKAHGLIRDQGDPGNRAVKFLCESALGLAVNTDGLPGGPQRGGILTPPRASEMFSQQGFAMQE